ncbi:type II and III secretion system protein [Flavobacterium sp. NRK F10]|uniref:Type II and III secretion system protein n=1 Tax=Flavobacterium sediminis TaxID=2201181 RepID=A0A2U8QY92_9FLAO|nr:MULTISPECIES: type II and III secretion system protein [Flavobacterium]AWM15190.1 type II and III secretion system protein [Flavobacterium sediminis]MCO6173441.1 type II and III secretion system protein [Flavobacterium sp. NRK F10]
MLKKLTTIIALCLFSNAIFAQEDITLLGQKFDEFAKIKPSINEVVKIDVSGLSLYDLIMAIAEEHQLNVSVDSDLNIPVVNTFHDVTVKDAFLFLTQKYDLEVGFMSNILTFKKRKEVKVIVKKEPKPIDVSYNPQNDFLSVKLQNDSLPSVAQAIIDRSGKNIVLAPDIKTLKVSSYILNRPFDQVIEMMAKSNDLIATKDDNGFYYLEKNTEPKESNPTVSGGRNNSRSRQRSESPDGEGFYDITVDDKGFLDVKANQADATGLLIEAAEKLNINYFIYDMPKDEKTSLMVSKITFDELLEHVFKGKKFTFRKQDDFYLIGEQSTQGLRSTEMIQLENRSIESVLQSLPKVFSEKVEIKEFVELNALIVSGSRTAIEEMKLYLKQIDKVVPLVQIEVIIVQYNKSYEIQTGLKAGLDKINQTTTSGVLFPSTDMTLNSSSVNNLIDAFNGIGFIKLGKVTDAFYLNLQLLENNSIIKIESTPKIATLSGHEANLSIGETSYYFEQTNRLLTSNVGTGGDVLQSGTWKSTDANLSVKIKPFVSTDENVTLNINVEKSSFLARAGENAPPGKTSQKFESLVRVKNNEMVLLGGLDELKKEDTGTGVPLISRIPVLKWFFSSKVKSKGKSKLHIFIKPTIVY